MDRGFKRITGRRAVLLMKAWREKPRTFQVGQEVEFYDQNGMWRGVLVRPSVMAEEDRRDYGYTKWSVRILTGSRTGHIDHVIEPVMFGLNDTVR